LWLLEVHRRTRLRALFPSCQKVSASLRTHDTTQQNLSLVQRLPNIDQNQMNARKLQTQAQKEQDGYKETRNM
jgi:hypothetical protein